MSISFAAALTHQIYGDKFSLLEEHLGADLVGAIPNHKPDFKGKQDEKYPPVFTDPNDMPADVVKGMLPSERVYVSFRYIMAKTNELVVGTIILRWSKESKYSAFYRWSGSSDNTSNKDPLFQEARLEKNHFAILKAMLNGDPLNKTDGRYLPMYKDRFTKE